MICLYNIFKPIDKCTIYISCETGLGDLLYETISAVTLTMVSGCKHTYVLTKYNREHGYYNLSRIRSHLFTFVAYENYKSWSSSQFILPYTSKMFIPQCGIKDSKWVSSYINIDESRVKNIMRFVSTNITISECTGRHMLSVHSRRGDKIQTRWSSISSLTYNYDYFYNWSIYNNIKKFNLASDDPVWAATCIKRFKLKNININYNRHQTAISDLCMLSSSHTIIRLGTTSTFSAISAIIGGVKLTVIKPNASDKISVHDFNRARAMDEHWINSNILSIKYL